MNISPVFWAAAVLSAMSAPADQKTAAEEAASSTGQYSVAGALRLPEQTTKRHVYGMNVGWKFFKGKDAPQGVTGADFDDSSWQSVNLPDGTELLPEEASGCSNYQGPVWYRKTFYGRLPI